MMPKPSKESVIAELDAKKIGYSDEMSYAELCALLNPPVPEEPKPEEPIDYTGILGGLSTIHGLHRRLTIVERRLAAIDA